MAGFADQPKWAVLIDAENAQASAIQEILEEIARHGIATLRRAYGDWSSPNLAGWRERLHSHAIQPSQQFNHSTGKNSSDIALVIDAMDILHAGVVDGFCLLSSDSDFTRLATRLRESGMKVMGFGEKKAPSAFVASCDRYFFTENLRKAPSAQATPAPQLEEAPLLEQMLRTAVEAAARDDGWSPLSAVGSLLHKTHPEFDTRTYNFKGLGDLVREQRWLETRTLGGDAGQPHHIQVRIRASS